MGCLHVSLTSRLYVIHQWGRLENSSWRGVAEQKSLRSPALDDLLKVVASVDHDVCITTPTD